MFFYDGYADDFQSRTFYTFPKISWIGLFPISLTMLLQFKENMKPRQKVVDRNILFSLESTAQFVFDDMKIVNIANLYMALVIGQ